jgi:hypothetical protein
MHDTSGVQYLQGIREYTFRQLAMATDVRSGMTTPPLRFRLRLFKHTHMNSVANAMMNPATETPMTTSTFTLPPEPRGGGARGGGTVGPRHVGDGFPEAGTITVRAIGGDKKIWPGKAAGGA